MKGQEQPVGFFGKVDKLSQLGCVATMFMFFGIPFLLVVGFISFVLLAPFIGGDCNTFAVGIFPQLETIAPDCTDSSTTTTTTTDSQLLGIGTGNDGNTFAPQLSVGLSVNLENSAPLLDANGIKVFDLQPSTTITILGNEVTGIEKGWTDINTHNEIYQYVSTELGNGFMNIDDLR